MDKATDRGAGTSWEKDQIGKNSSEDTVDPSVH